MADSLPHPSKLLSSCLTKRIRRFAVVTLLAAGTLAALDAEAKRMGGGRSMGRQSQTMQRESAPLAPQQSARSAQPGQPAPAGAQAQRAQAAQPAPAARSRWLGPIAGLAAGLGIAALLSHFGLGAAFASAMANVIIVALLAMVGIWVVRKLLSLRRRHTGPALAGGALPTGRDAFSGPQASTGASAWGSTGAVFPSARDAGQAAFARPADFDEAAFLHHAKTNFVRLQAAWDTGNLADIRAFATPEMFAELERQQGARGGEHDRTDVVQLDAELVDLAEDAFEYRASVRYSGLIREGEGAAAQPFAENWQLSKPKRGGDGWLLAGIEQSEPRNA